MISQGKSAVADVYPSLWTWRFPRAVRDGDEQSAFVAAAWLQRADQSSPLWIQSATDAGKSEVLLLLMGGFSGSFETATESKSAHISHCYRLTRAQVMRFQSRCRPAFTYVHRAYLA